MRSVSFLARFDAAASSTVSAVSAFVALGCASALVQSSSPPSARSRLGRRVRSVEQLANHAPSLPRSGSIIGTRFSVSSPTSNTRESQLAATSESPYLATHRPGSRRGCRSAASVDGRLDLVVGEQPLHPTGGGQPVVEAPSRVDIVVLQVEQAQLGVVPVQPVPVPVVPASSRYLAAQSSRSAVDSGSRSRSSSTDSHSVEDLLVGLARRPVVLDVLAGPLQVAPLQLRGRSSVPPSASSSGRFKSRSWLTRQVASTGLARRSVSGMAPSSIAMRIDGGRTELDEVLDLAHVGVADDDVEPAVLRRIAVRLVAGVDDRTLEGGLEADLLLEEVGPLGELERDCRDGRSRTPSLPEPVKI